jgi:hypothetical protein
LVAALSAIWVPVRRIGFLMMSLIWSVGDMFASRHAACDAHRISNHFDEIKERNASW